MEPNLKLSFTAPWRVELVESPAPQPGPGEVLIETRKTLISTGTELILLSGEAWSPLSRPGFKLPQVGYSSVGTVLAVGEGVSRDWIGRRVASRSVHARYATCLVEPVQGQWRSGVFPIPADVKDEEATLFALGLTALNGLKRGGIVARAGAGAGAGERVAVVGLGLLGQLAVRAAMAMGVGDVCAIGRGAARLAFLPAGVRGVAGGVETAREQAGERDLVVEVTGEPSAIGPCLELAKKGGRLVLLGSSRGPSTIDLHHLCCEPYRTIIGADIEGLPAKANEDGWCVAEAARTFFDTLVPQLRAAPSVITHRFPVADAPAAYERLRAEPTTTLACTLDWR